MPSCPALNPPLFRASRSLVFLNVKMKRGTCSMDHSDQDKLPRVNQSCILISYVHIQCIY